MTDLDQLEQRESNDIRKARQSPLWDRAVEFLSHYIPQKQIEQIRKMHARDPGGWYIPHHLFWGMHIRNKLRSVGYGENDFAIENLDHIYIPLVEEACLDE